MQLDTTDVNHYNIISALRGPDFLYDRAEQDRAGTLKSALTAPFRTLAGMGERVMFGPETGFLFYQLLDESSDEKQAARLNQFGLPSTYYHFDYHIKYGLESMKQVERDLRFVCDALNMVRHHAKRGTVLKEHIAAVREAWENHQKGIKPVDVPARLRVRV